MAVQAACFGKCPHRRGGQTFDRNAPLVPGFNVTTHSLRLAFTEFLRKAWQHTYPAAPSDDLGNILPIGDTGYFGEEFLHRLFLAEGYQHFPEMILKYMFHNLSYIDRPGTHAFNTDPPRIVFPNTKGKRF